MSIDVRNLVKTRFFVFLKIIQLEFRIKASFYKTLELGEHLSAFRFIKIKQ